MRAHGHAGWGHAPDLPHGRPSRPKDGRREHTSRQSSRTTTSTPVRPRRSPHAHLDTQRRPRWHVQYWQQWRPPRRQPMPPSPVARGHRKSWRSEQGRSPFGFSIGRTRREQCHVRWSLSGRTRGVSRWGLIEADGRGTDVVTIFFCAVLMSSEYVTCFISTVVQSHMCRLHEHE